MVWKEVEGEKILFWLKSFPSFADDKRHQGSVEARNFCTGNWLANWTQLVCFLLLLVFVLKDKKKLIYVRGEHCFANGQTMGLQPGNKKQNHVGEETPFL